MKNLIKFIVVFLMGEDLISISLRNVRNKLYEGCLEWSIFSKLVKG